MKKTWQYTQTFTWYPPVNAQWEEIARSAQQIVEEGLWPVSCRVEVLDDGDGWYKLVTKFKVET